MKITWSDRTVADLTEIRDHIAEDSEANGRRDLAGMEPKPWQR